MTKSRLLVAVLMATAVAGCVVEPGRVVPRYQAPPGVIYIAPTYEIPGPGYRWAYHENYGWGWHHPDYGWHRGWR